MSGELFSQPWVDAWKDQINRSAGYAKAASSWNDNVGLVIEPAGADDDTVAILLDLHSGSCRRARRSPPEELESADYVLSAPRPVWMDFLENGRDPVWALMSGKVKLTRGSLTGLMPYAGAAKQLLAAAQGIVIEELESESPAVESESSGSDAARATVEPGSSESDKPTAAPVPERTSYRSTGQTGLDRSSPPMRLWEKAKVRGVWNPAEIDFTQDRQEWSGLTSDERDLLIRETSLFLAGEEAVTLDLLPLLQVIAAEGRLEEEIYLTSFLWEEAKHVDAFSRFFEEIATERDELDRFHTESYRHIFYRELPAALARLRTDDSPEAQAEASVTYHMIVEGVLAETGYHAYYTVLDRHRVLPGMRTLVGHVQSDEARHLAYGVFLLSRLVAEHGDRVWLPIERRMEELLPVALRIIEEAFAAYDPVPFGLSPADFVDFAQDQFRRRFSRIEKARRQSLDEVYRISLDTASA